ncbi:AAA family ATPase [Lichenibacterium dinghuense]|uniref:AAA family ATPase n=1 Tax=Lichenibacterium dinghuense TaxID=2895977 RepID=UPI001F1D2A15|nr:ATP-binding protein [Lichenibacterium sp. 6Y81]
MSGTFLDALRAAHEVRVATSRLLAAVPALTVTELYGAVLLDGTGWEPTDLMSGTTVFANPDPAVALCVTDCLRRIYGADGMLLLGHGSHASSFDRAVRAGLPVAIVIWDRSAVLPGDLVALADRDMDIAVAPCEATYVEDLILAVTGEDVELSSALCERLEPETLLRAVRTGSTVADCLARLEALARHVDEVKAEQERQEQEDARELLARAAAKTPPVTVGQAAQGVVRRLSQMTGFGEAQTWGVNLARDLAAYRAGSLPWADVDRGLLLSGPPGGGKTTYARALALECDVELVTTTYTEWSGAGGGYGDSMSKGLTKLFETWRTKAKSAPFLLFVDEIDSMGRRGGNDHNESWFTAIINSWLAFLDGAVPRDGIVVVAATNYPDRVDPALVRPGRLERHIELPIPDIDALAGIVRAHLGADAMLTDAEVAEAARAVRGRSPAQVQLLAREARRVARWCGRRVCASDLTDAVAMLREPRHADVDWRIELLPLRLGHRHRSLLQRDSFGTHRV